MLKKILSDLYSVRYSEEEKRLKKNYWKILCEDFFQKFIDKNATVLDLAAGHCEFINNIKGFKKYAVDIDSRIKKYADKNVAVIIAPAEKLPANLTQQIDVVFMGCFLEHLPSKDAIVKVFHNIFRILKPGGKLIILNPNFRFSTAEYWDYFDHLIPVSDRSIIELLKAMKYKIDYYLPKFVPNTIKDKLPKSPYLLKLYLRMPYLFPIFGKQMFIVARKQF
ncbi:hypothetical protein A3D05_03145 [Candidatus Gottesmanbacteria bacterium RIFCSPHIGHO2_02_FULL_40_24]|uniref:Methyltransferase type 11 domain-containing protein n=1 Tax=Candidatus Gottesmanbacteria bacterium RIFCSPHIGHO2_01_FULL_40_15 TaxID=1798376 RepID=A0A1F5Z0M2_9BACT|nr:MAG: hypothetical protein A2777_04725 [Candidatus Gottesmanbacteria bacterium RIFCSPHIGHO2_01_FULL_40_15]OGG17688.1 MAG: hypothetical protein A3D05_03145 [Candidatus Gottesmanbacteria bacterium RIFCSPHIGHO2_02_FULL_40_24]OGG21603.1 MAG: hypothetical protein A3B48_04820 [Candidatus Gottesmanbacteria bacterium RIFCSPLOWO2_01_FULL_40_10]OGG24795.1 MAG: hypothetical protein A3E42_02375 [Candidatus Gottesmanbacteria bacterium RIFCSPHIGHO2_12_FULL_40_13]OGG33077.1 MAG: hypothetical protein A3I80_0